MSSLTAKLEQLWDSAPQPPDLTAWLAENSTNTSCATDEVVKALQLDQQRRWKTAQPLPVEDYLSRLPRLASDIQWRLKLVAGERIARMGSSNPLADEELQRRFPDLWEHIIRSGLPTTISSSPASWIDQTGRYRWIEFLGEGTFGTVHLAYDEELYRQVAVKVSKLETYDLENYRKEARAGAKLVHPNIVQVYDVGVTGDGRIYIVSQYICGEKDKNTLADRLKQGRPDFRWTAEILATVASALHFVHDKHRLIHCDVKPANILIEEGTDTPFVADFGLAIQNNQLLIAEKVGNQFGGTAAYASPEQARAESHRLDGRSDLFSLGVILYEMLTGHRPFQGTTKAAVLEAVKTHTPAAPTSLDPSIPAELERICLKALSKLRNERHASAAEFAADLQAWLNPASPPPTSRLAAKLEPRGLRSFDEQDKDFFPELLPGPRNRDQLPESIAFWRRKIEEPAAASTFSVGVIYGRSGCGKSSLVKAGLLPRLPPELVTIYLEATPNTTEQQLCTTLRRRLPHLPPSGELVELFQEIRNKPGPKVAIFLDQFEQWLLARSVDAEQPLVLALQQCDGAKLQTVLMIREDFWGGVTQLMKQAEVELVQQHNFAMVELFDIPHAARVLRQLGSAYGCLPAPPLELTAPQSEFIAQAVDQLAVKDEVIPVRLALFAQMVRSKPWEPATLEQMGGLAGVGVVFLEETFTRDVRYRQHQQAVRHLLKALLPKVSTDIKGSMKPASELQTESGYGNRDQDFRDLLRILDSELRLITPTVPETQGTAADLPLPANSPLAPSDSPSYQLTHDYLVPSIREWLARKQRETAAGQAELILEERTDRWSEKREFKQLPSLGEWLRIRLRTDRSRWTGLQREMMRVAGFRILLHSLQVLALLIMMISGGLLLYSNTLVDNIEKLELSSLRRATYEMRPLSLIVRPLLVEKQKDAVQKGNVRVELLTILSRLQLDADTDKLSERELRRLLDAVRHCRPEELVVLATLLENTGKNLTDHLTVFFMDTSAPRHERLNTACILAGLTMTSDGIWSNKSTVEFLVPELFSIAKKSPAIMEHYESAIHSQAESWVPVLADTIVATPVGAEVGMGVWPLLERNRELAVDYLESLKLLQSEPLSAAATAILKLDFARMNWQLLADSRDPTTRNLVLQRLARFQINSGTLLNQIREQSNTVILRALIQGVGELAQQQMLSPSEQRDAKTQLQIVHGDHRDPGVHSMADWALRQLGEAPNTSEDTPEWSIVDGTFWERKKFGGVDMEFAVIDGRKERRIRERDPAIDLEKDELRRPFDIGRVYAIGLTEVTWRQYLRSLEPNDPKFHEYRRHGMTNMDRPAFHVNWHQAAAYCNWLSREDEIPEDQWCYEAKDHSGISMKLKPHWQELDGYRLPTESEWEFTCRGGSESKYNFGDNEKLSTDYAWYIMNAWPKRGAPFNVGILRPNNFGAFDMHGHVKEWCQDIYRFGGHAAADSAAFVNDIENDLKRVHRGGAFNYYFDAVHSSARDGSEASHSSDGVGFRVARSCRLRL